jgi:hypothetical protein
MHMVGMGACVFSLSSPYEASPLPTYPDPLPTTNFTRYQVTAFNRWDRITLIAGDPGTGREGLAHERA